MLIGGALLAVGGLVGGLNYVLRQIVEEEPQTSEVSETKTDEMDHNSVNQTQPSDQEDVEEDESETSDEQPDDQKTGEEPPPSPPSDTPDQQDTTEDTVPAPTKEETLEPAEDENSVSHVEKDTPEPPKPVERHHVYTEELNLIKGGGNPAVQALWTTWIERMLDRGEVSVLAPILEEKIREAMPRMMTDQRLIYTSYRNAKLLMEAVELCYMARMVGAERLDHFVKPGRRRGERGKNSPDQFVRWLLLDKSKPLHRLLHAFAENNGKEEDFPRVLKTFYELWKNADDKKRVRYMNLAAACALLREDVVNSPGRLRDIDEPLMSLQEIFDYFCQQDAINALRTDIKKISISDLMYLVDMRLPLSEVQWTKKNLKYKRSEWGQAYGHIKYLMKRATMGLDPYDHYTFEEIENEGGICADQSYFCANTAKCLGIPSVIFVGDGDRGPHAWVGLLTADRTWTSAGSIGYSSGRYKNPCSGVDMHESVLLGQDTKLPPDKMEIAGNCMLLAYYLNMCGFASQAVNSARYVTTMFPQLTPGWINLVDVMERCNQEEINRVTWQRLFIALTKQGKKNPELLDLAQQVQNDHLIEGKRQNVRMYELKKSSKRVGELVKEGRLDLMRDMLKRQVDIFVKEEDYGDMATFFKRYMRDYVNNADVFDQLLQLYMSSLDACEKKIRDKEDLDQKHKDQAVNNIWRTCAKDAAGFFSKAAFGSDDFFAVKKEAGVMNRIAECWRRAGDDKRAVRLEKVAYKTLEEARERASKD